MAQRQKSRHSNSRVTFSDQHASSLDGAYSAEGLQPLDLELPYPSSPPGTGTRMPPSNHHNLPSPHSSRLDDVTIASQQSHEEAIKKTLQLMDGNATKSKKPKPKAMSSGPAPAIASPHHETDGVPSNFMTTPQPGKSSSSFLPSLGSGTSTPRGDTHDQAGTRSGFSSPASSTTQRRRTTPQLPPPPSRQRPGPDFSRTVLSSIVPEVSESQTSLVMLGHDPAQAIHQTTVGNHHYAPGETYPGPGRSCVNGTASTAAAFTVQPPTASESSLRKSVSPVAVVTPLQTPSGSRTVSSNVRRPQQFLDSIPPVSPSELSLSMCQSRPFSILSSALSKVSDSDALQKVLQDMAVLLDSVLENERTLVSLPGPELDTKESGALRSITEALVSVHDQFTSRMKQMLDSGIDSGVIDADIQNDISQLLLGYLSLTARTVHAQCSAMKHRIGAEGTTQQGELDKVKEDFLAEKIQWAAEAGKTKENLQAEKDLLAKQKEILQSVGSSLQLERHHLEEVMSEMPADTQQQIRERIAAHQQQHRHSHSSTSLTASGHDMLTGGADRPPMLHRSITNLAAGDSQLGMSGLTRRSCVPGRTELVALREVQEEKARLEKLLCRHQMELKTMKEQQDWAKSGMAVMNETKRVAEHQVDLERKQALRAQSDLQVRLTASEANAHRFEEMWSLEKRKQEELSSHLLRASTELEEARAELKVKAQMTQELQLLRQQLTEQVTVQQRLRNQLANSQRAGRELQDRLNQSAARWVRAKKDEERERIEKKWQKITRDAVQLKRASAFQGANPKRR